MCRRNAGPRRAQGRTRTREELYEGRRGARSLRSLGSEHQVTIKIEHPEGRAVLGRGASFSALGAAHRRAQKPEGPISPDPKPRLRPLEIQRLGHPALESFEAPGGSLPHAPGASRAARTHARLFARIDHRSMLLSATATRRSPLRRRRSARYGTLASRCRLSPWEVASMRPP